MNNEGGAAGWIAAGCIVFVGVIIKMRGFWSAESRQIRYDKSSIDWQADREREIEELRAQVKAMWGHKVDDAKKISQLEAENSHLQQKVGFLEQRIAILEGNAK